MPAAPVLAGVLSVLVVSVAAHALVGSTARQPRPFRHSQHELLSCRECHGTGEAHRTTRIETPRDCAACHHDPGLSDPERRPFACTACHAAGDLPEPGPVPTVLALTVWEDARPRDLPFAHETHAELACRDCHTGPVTLEREVECATCHVEHHTPEAECASCHLLPTDPEAHGLKAHLTCSGSGCHSAERGERPALSRTLCLMCHAEQRDHEPSGDCATCHMIPASASPPPPRAPPRARAP